MRSHFKSVPNAKSQLFRLASALAVTGGIPRYSDEISRCIAAHDVKGLLAIDIVYQQDDHPVDAQLTRQILGLFSKNPSIDLGINTREAAIIEWTRCELRNAETNIRLTTCYSQNELFSAAVLAAQFQICGLLGEVPKLENLEYRFGPGVTAEMTSKTTQYTGGYYKLARSTGISPDLARSGFHRSSSPVRFEPDFKQVETLAPARLEFVPKNAKTDRPIAVEPGLMIPLQKGVGSYLKGRLKQKGIDLKSQSRNQRLACQSSIDDRLATVDMKSASDLISLGMVVLLLPEDWVEFLGALRSSHITTSVLPKGNCYELEKFSSMGNGFTFELETLLFWGIAKAIASNRGIQLDDSNFAVYGDDVILPSEMYTEFCDTVEYLGCQVNRDKSYASGPFRESCGGDYLLGTDIRPFYVKDVLSPHTLYCLHNSLIRKGFIPSDPVIVAILACLVKERVTRNGFSKASRLVPIQRLYGPDGYGDVWLLGEFNSYSCSEEELTRGFTVRYVKGVKPKTNRLSASNIISDRLFPVYSASFISEDPLHWLDIATEDDGRSVRTDKRRRIGYVCKMAIFC